jgi:hypothetical protein
MCDPDDPEDVPGQTILVIKIYVWCSGAPVKWLGSSKPQMQVLCASEQVCIQYSAVLMHHGLEFELQIWRHELLTDSVE